MKNCLFLESFWQNTLTISAKIVGFSKIVGEIQRLVRKRSQKNYLRHTFAFNFTSYLSIALSKILLHSETIKNAKRLLVFGENDSRSYQDDTSAFFDIFSKKDLHLNAVEF